MVTEKLRHKNRTLACAETNVQKQIFLKVYHPEVLKRFKYIFFVCIFTLIIVFLKNMIGTVQRTGPGITFEFSNNKKYHHILSKN